MTTGGLWDFVLRPEALAVLGVTVLMAWPIGRRIADRAGSHRAIAVSLVLAVGVVAAFTITPNYPAPGVPVTLPAHYLTKLDEPRLVWAKLTAAPSDAEQYANIALYVPVGLLAALVWRSVIRGALFGAALTLVIETCQAGIVGRAGSLTDIRNNTVGALVGAFLAAVAVQVLRRTVAGIGPFRPRPRPGVGR